IGNRLRSLALQVTEFALEHHPRQFVLFDAVKARQVALQETLQTPPAIRNIRRANLSIGQQRLGGRVFQHRHPCRSPIGLLRACVGRLAYLLGKNGYSPTIRSDVTPNSSLAASTSRFLKLRILICSSPSVDGFGPSLRYSRNQSTTP